MTTAEFRPGPDIIAPRAPNFSELHYHIRIDSMTSEEKLHWLSDHILKEEHRLLREPYNMSSMRPEAKIMFLTGGETGDVTEGRDFEGNLIHTRHIDRPRPMAAEIQESTNAISHWFDLVRQNQDLDIAPPSPVAPLSEIADVVYNISHLLTLDPGFRNEYHEYLSQIAGSLGYNLDQLLTLVVYKYNFRLGQGKSQKNIELENNLIEKVLAKKASDGKPLFPIPTEAKFQKTYHTLSKIQSLLNTRLVQLKQEHEWEKNSVVPKEPSK